MTEEQMRIAIAEACGWTEIVHHKLHAGNEGLLGTHIAADGVRDRDWVPDYLNDLNAMHEAEKVLVEKGVNSWWAYVALINRHNPTPFGLETAVQATARQRAEAFLKTKGILP